MLAQRREVLDARVGIGVRFRCGFCSGGGGGGSEGEGEGGGLWEWAGGDEPDLCEMLRRQHGEYEDVHDATRLLSREKQVNVQVAALTLTLLSAPHVASLHRLSLSLLSSSDKSSAAALVRAEGLDATEAGEGGRGWKSAEKMGLRVGVCPSQFTSSARCNSRSRAA